MAKKWEYDATEPSGLLPRYLSGELKPDQDKAIPFVLKRRADAPSIEQLMLGTAAELAARASREREEENRILNAAIAKDCTPQQILEGQAEMDADAADWVAAKSSVSTELADRLVAKIEENGRELAEWVYASVEEYLYGEKDDA